MTTTAEMQEAEEAAVNVLWMSTRSLERIWGEHRQTGASTYQVANGKFDRFINPLVLKSDFDAMRAQRDEARGAVDRLAKIATVLGKWGFEMSSLKQLSDLEERAKAAGLRIEDLGPFTVGAYLSEPSPSNSGDTP